MPAPPLSRRRLLRAAAAAALGPPAVTVAAPSASPARRRRTASPQHFVLVHGAWHGAWCWYKVVAGLEAAGHRVTAIDLPSAGIDTTPAAAVTLAAQAERVLDVLRAEPEPVVLVGHSAGGAVISTVAEAAPSQLRALVYVAAYLLPDGVSMLGISARDPDSEVVPSIVLQPDGTSAIDPAARRSVFYGDCSDRDVALAQSLLKPFSLAVTASPVRVGAAFASVRRFYVTCLRDRAITPAAQERMFTALPCERVFALRSDHSPFLSHAGPLLRAFDAIARASG